MVKKTALIGFITGGFIFVLLIILAITSFDLIKGSVTLTKS